MGSELQASQSGSSSRRGRDGVEGWTTGVEASSGVAGPGSGGASAGATTGGAASMRAGACVGAESPAKHALRAKLALAPLKLRAWPYPGPVAVEEKDALGVRHWHVIDGWQYLGTQVLEAGPDHAVTLDSKREGFDADTYRILVRHLKPGARGVRPWPPELGSRPESGSWPGSAPWSES